MKFVVSLSAVLLLIPAAFSQTTTRGNTPAPAQVTPARDTQAIVAPPRPAIPATPANAPPQPPAVNYQNGLLSISADNSALGDILNAVRAQTGGQIEIPPAAAGQRIFIRVSPEPPREAMVALLSGTGFNYVIVGKPQDPDGLGRLILSPRVPVPQSNAMASPFPQSNADQGDSDSNPQPAPQPTPAAEGTPATQPDANAANQQPQNQPKTPQQLLQELQQMQQQQQQQTQNGQPAKKGLSPPH